MKKIEDLTYYELLEVAPNATAQEIHRAYERVRRIYEPNSIALYSLFTPEETAAIHQRIEDAYRTLVYEDNRKKYDAKLRGAVELPEPAAPSHQRYYEPPSPSPQRPMPRSLPEPAAPHPADVPQPEPQPPVRHEEVTPVAPFIGEYTGPAIRALRELRGLSLSTVANQTKVSSRYLESIEEETFQKLPARTYTRGFLMLYAKALGCDPERFASDYLRRFDAATKPLKAK
ncbi:MAG TPA: helix-turn-helix domain-containing protein [Nitrospirota bacterium]|nr:helix-turn-helix domain-containing protein [Nitrospirota bacterium]